MDESLTVETFTAAVVMLTTADFHEFSELPQRPAENCGHINPGDGTCAHPDNMTPECHADACPLVRSGG